MPTEAPTNTPKTVAGGMTTATASSSTGKTVTLPASNAKRDKVVLLVGVGLAFALANTQAAPLVIALLAGGIVYQLVNLA